MEHLEFNITTPALLFPAISLLLLAYTNRFLALAALIRELHSKYKEKPNEVLKGQIENLRKRVLLIRDMQGLGIASLFLCVFTMLLLFWGKIEIAGAIFGVSLLLMLLSLAYSIREIQLSVGALNLHLSDIGLGQNQSNGPTR